MTKRELQDSFDALAIVAAELLVAAQDHKGLSADLDKCFWACIRGTKIEPKVVHVLTRPKPETQKTGADRLAEACGIYPSKKNMIVFIGKDNTRWPFEQLTGLPHPNTNDLVMLQKYGQAALNTDDRLLRFEIVSV